MKCYSDSGNCAHTPKCEHACILRVQPVFTRPPTPMGWSDSDWMKHLQDVRNEGWNECMLAWADHMKRMAAAVFKGKP
jgi:hypothetical protein